MSSIAPITIRPTLFTGALPSAPAEQPAAVGHAPVCAPSPSPQGPTPLAPGKIVPPLRPAISQTLRVPELAAYGDTTLLLVPTENKGKVAMFTAHEQARGHTNLLVKAQKEPSDVPEQPYDAEGPQGALNRTQHAIHWLSSTEGKGYLAAHGIGTVVVNAMESFIQLADVDEPSDFGCMVRTDVTHRTCEMGFTRGVTVPTDCLLEARRRGSDVTAGKVIAEWHPGVPADDWHLARSGVSRYDLGRQLMQAMASGS